MKRESAILILMLIPLGLPMALSQESTLKTHRIALPDGSIYEGAMSNGCFEGRGGLVYPSGDSFEGIFHQGMMHGPGVFRDKTGGFCQGNYSNGVLQGLGVQVWNDGSRYEGEFKDDQQNGIGVLSRPDGTVYRGQFRDGAMSGTGVYTRASGAVYQGELQAGDFEGMGKMIYASKDQYVGQFKKGEPHGKGVLHYANGARYEGEFKNGLPDGHGLLRYPNGDSYEGEFSEGEIVDPRGARMQTEVPRTFLWLGLGISVLINVVLVSLLQNRMPSDRKGPACGDDEDRETSDAISMKKVFTAPGIVPCDMLKSVLASHGIECQIRNEPSSGVGLGDPVPMCPTMTFSWPEVWVLEQDVAKAKALVEEMSRLRETSTGRSAQDGDVTETSGT